jgi:NADH dehydrogenase
MSDGRSPHRPRVLVVGTGFAGYHCLRMLERRLPCGQVEVVAVNPTDYMLYVPLLPEVAGGTLDPRRVAVALRPRLPQTSLVLGHVVDVDVIGRRCTAVDVEGRCHGLDFDWLVVASGSVTRLLSIPGVGEHARGFKSVAEAVFLRDHVLRQLEFAELADDPHERAARVTFVVVGAGYTGTELVAHASLLTRDAVRNRRQLSEHDIRWVLVDIAPRVLPGLDERLSEPTLRVLRARGIDVRLRSSVAEVTEQCVRLTDGAEIPTRTVVWCVGVRPDPLVQALGLPTEQGRLIVDDYLRVPGSPHVYAAGDVAAVADRRHPGRLTPMTAQHAQRQGRTAAINLAACLGHGRPRRYRHRDLGFVVDLGAGDAVADPLHIPLEGCLATAVARGYHLLALPGNRLRVATDWLIDLVTDRQLVQFGMVPEQGIRLTECDRLPAAGPVG